MKKILMFIVLFLWGYFYAFSQAEDISRVNNQIAFPQLPTEAALGKYGEYPVNLQNGLIDISIPLYKIKSRSLESTISLSYHASGIKIDEEASWIGLGWSLNSGGVITRRIKGAPDEKGFVTGYNSIPSPSNFCLSDMHDFETIEAYFNGRLDGEPDVYNYNFNGFTGQFIMGNDGIYHTLGLDNLKIEVDYSKHRIMIKTSDGISYQFGLGLDGENATSITSITDYKHPYEGDPYAINSWYLTSIISSDLSDTIQFFYQDFGVSSMITGTQYESILINTSNPNERIGTISHDYSASSYSLGCIKPSEIIFQNGKVVFEVKEDRLDRPLQRLNKIILYQKQVGSDTLYNKSEIIQLNESYFNRTWNSYVVPWSHDLEGRNKKSLKLEGLDFLSKDGVIRKSYAFKYDSTNLPARGTTAQDYWGYYNGQLSNHTLIPETKYNTDILGNADRKPNAEAMQAGILTEIIYPTGGRTEFSYEPNYYIDEYTYRTGNQIKYVSTTENVMAIGNVNNDNINVETKLVDKFIFTSPTDHSTILTYEITPYCGYKNEEYPSVSLIDNEDGDVVFEKMNPDSSSIQTGTQEVFLRKGKSYSLIAKVCNCTYPNSIIGAAYASANLSIYKEIQVKDSTQWVAKIGGGLRVKEIQNYDNGSMDPILRKRYIYGKIQVKDNIGVGHLTSSIPESNTTHVANSYNLSQGTTGETARDVSFFVNSNSYLDWTYNGNSSVQYDKVTEEIIHGTEINGKKEYYYSLPETEMGFDANWYFPYDFLIYPQYKSGKLQRIDELGIINNELKLLSREENVYEILKLLKIKAFKVIKEEQDNSGWKYSPLSMIKQYRLENYYVYTGAYKLSSRKVEIYDSQGENKINTNNNFKYDTIYHQLSESSIFDSQGSKHSKLFKYPYNVNELTGLSLDQHEALLKMIDNYQISPVIDAKNFVGNNIVQWSQYRYKRMPDNAIVFDGVDRAYDNENLKNIFQIDTLDNFKNIIQFHDSTGIKTSILYAYNNSLPIIFAKNIGSTILTNGVNDIITALGYSSIDEFLGRLNNFAVSYDRELLSLFITSIRNYNWGQQKAFQITTYTYKPLIGMTSQTDPNGKTTYYQYDDFGRLEMAKDDDGNIVKKYNYHYAE